jgi:hypothetical protein
MLRDRAETVGNFGPWLLDLRRTHYGLTGTSTADRRTMQAETNTKDWTSSNSSKHQALTSGLMNFDL